MARFGRVYFCSCYFPNYFQDLKYDLKFYIPNSSQGLDFVNIISPIVSKICNIIHVTVPRRLNLAVGRKPSQDNLTCLLTFKGQSSRGKGDDDDDVDEQYEISVCT